MDPLFDFQPMPDQRLVVVWPFLAIALILVVQLSQRTSPRPFLWTRLTSQSKPNWYILYILKSLLFIQNACPILLKSMDGYANGFEERVLNTVWIGLLGIEVLMVLGVAVQGVIKRFGPQPKQRTA